MAAISTLKVYPKCEAFINKVFDRIDAFPKKDKYTIGNSLKDACLKMFSLIAEANMSRTKEERVKYLDDFFVNFETVKILLRLCLNRKDISVKHHTSLSGDITLIEKDIFAWKNYINKDTKDDGQRNSSSKKKSVYRPIVNAQGLFSQNSKKN